MTETDRAYWAGILDGEGCLGLGRRLKKYVTPTVQVSNTKMALLVWIQERLGGHIYKYSPRVDNRAPCYLWSCAGQRALAAVREAYPYLILKREQADILLALPRFVNKRVGQPTMTSQDVALNEAAVTNIRLLNKRGA